MYDNGLGKSCCKGSPVQSKVNIKFIKESAVALMFLHSFVLSSKSIYCDYTLITVFLYYYELDYILFYVW